MTHCFVFHFLHKIIITPGPGTQVFIQVIVSGFYYFSIPHMELVNIIIYLEKRLNSNTILKKMIITISNIHVN